LKINKILFDVYQIDEKCKYFVKTIKNRCFERICNLNNELLIETIQKPGEEGV